MPKFKIKVKIEETAFRYVEAASEEEAKAIYNGEVDGKDLNDIEYDYTDCCTNEDFISITKIEE